jgi:mRNA interferase HigB
LKVIGTNRLEQFGQKHSQAKSALRAWLKIARESEWKNLVDIRCTIGSVSGGVKKSYTVFNIGGNDFRLICLVNYKTQTILVTDIFTHAEYDKWSRS